jgi:hypothetical protein
MKNIGRYLGLIIISLVVIVGCVAFYLFSGSSTPDLTATNVSDTSSGSQLLDLLNQSRSITLDLSIFSNPVFEALVDSNEPIAPEPVGRPDPFLPLGSPSTPATGGSK